MASELLPGGASWRFLSARIHEVYGLAVLLPGSEWTRSSSYRRHGILAELLTPLHGKGRATSGKATVVPLDGTDSNVDTRRQKPVEDESSGICPLGWP